MPSKLSVSLLLLPFAVLLMILTGCGHTSGHYEYIPLEDTPSPVASWQPEPPSSPASETAPISETIPTPETPPPQASVPAFTPYEFGVPLEECEAAEDDSVFEHAVFLGDSRTEGLQRFGGLEAGTFYWARGMSVFRADNEDYKLFEINGTQYTLVGTLSQNSYDAVYIMIGVNELGYPVESYKAGLSEMVDKVLAAQPEAVVYLQIMPPLNDAMCRANKLGSYINNDNLNLFNEALIQVAEEKRVVLLNTAEVYTGEDGQLPPEMASDGCHFAANAYFAWSNYLRCHIIDRERYFYSRELEAE